jgi:hypothetical protein
MLKAGVLPVRVQEFAPAYVAFGQSLCVMKLKFRGDRKQCGQIADGEVEPRRGSRDIQNRVPSASRIHVETSERKIAVGNWQ